MPTIIKTLLIAAIAFLFDQCSKWYVVWYLDLRNLTTIDVIDPFLTFKLGWNKGINFGFLSDSLIETRWFLSILAIGISLALLLWSSKFRGLMPAIFFGLTIGGALSNAFDRIKYGAVIDFLNVSCCNFNNTYVFNLADIWIFFGIIGLIIFEKRLKII